MKLKKRLLKKRNEIIEEKVEPVIVQPVLQKNSQKEESKDDKHFEPISFDDLFKDDF